MKKLFMMICALTALTATSALAARSFGTCYAYTSCLNRFGQLAGTISCTVSGNSSAGVACEWYTQAYQGVSCAGFAYDQFGNYGWMTLSDSCARFW